MALTVSGLLNVMEGALSFAPGVTLTEDKISAFEAGAEAGALAEEPELDVPPPQAVSNSRRGNTTAIIRRTDTLSKVGRVDMGHL